jgi:hypothetical protein
MKKTMSVAWMIRKARFAFPGAAKRMGDLADLELWISGVGKQRRDFQARIGRQLNRQAAKSARDIKRLRIKAAKLGHARDRALDKLVDAIDLERERVKLQRQLLPLEWN